MKQRQITNIPASIRGRLLHTSRATYRPFAEVLQYYAIERFLYRLSRSPFAERFFLRGALLFIAWSVETHRPTMDIDLLAKIENTPEKLINIIREVCEQKVEENDGIVFLPQSVHGEKIQLKSEYEGTRISFQAELADARIFMQIDIGFGDVISPEPVSYAFPTILKEFSSPLVKGYTRDSLIAEKLHTMVRRQLDNTRMKDFFDVWFLSEQFVFSGERLSEAIQTTFMRRKTDFPVEIVSFLNSFQVHQEKYQQWDSFCKKNAFKNTVPVFPLIVERIILFLNPIVAAAHAKTPFQGTWMPKESWR